MAIATINPATGELLKSFEPLTDAQIEVKLQKAADTFSSTAMCHSRSAHE